MIKAILFYSKEDRKSMRMKEITESLGTDMELVCVDSRRVREALLDDEKYGVSLVPSVLLLYSGGHHRVYSGQQLDTWFSKLIENIQSLSTLGSQFPPSTLQFSPLPLESSPEPVEGWGSGMGDAGTASRMVSTAIRDTPQAQTPPQTPVDEPVQTLPPPPPAQAKTSKEIKKSGMSAAEMGKMMAEQREQEIKKEDPNPFNKESSSTVTQL